MGSNLIPAVVTVIGIIIGVIGQWINSRNDRNLTNQEVDILTKLDPNSSAARELSKVIEFRVAKWYGKILKSRRAEREASNWGIASFLLVMWHFAVERGESVMQGLVALR